MMAGPQIMSAIILVTNPQARRVSSAFIAGVALATAVGVAIMTGLANLLDLGDPSDTGSTGKVIQFALVGLLVAAAIKNYVKRETVEPPKWLGALQRADARKAFTTGLLIILLMPSDLVVMATVGVNIAQNDSSLASALPFWAATVLVAALPLLLYVLFHRRAQEAMPKLRDWMNSHSWVINIIVCAIFIVLIVS
jgi:threonine/homoserine/homoserine lactone efflux protein